jgi:hypothetical protein
MVATGMATAVAAALWVVAGLGKVGLRVAKGMGATPGTPAKAAPTAGLVTVRMASRARVSQAQGRRRRWRARSRVLL